MLLRLKLGLKLRHSKPTATQPQKVLFGCIKWTLAVYIQPIGVFEASLYLLQRIPLHLKNGAGKGSH